LKAQAQEVSLIPKSWVDYSVLHQLTLHHSPGTIKCRNADDRKQPGVGCLGRYNTASVIRSHFNSVILPRWTPHNTDWPTESQEKVKKRLEQQISSNKFQAVEEKYQFGEFQLDTDVIFHYDWLSDETQLISSRGAKTRHVVLIKDFV